jgi:hypothetical protein
MKALWKEEERGCKRLLGLIPGQLEDLLTVESRQEWLYGFEESRFVFTSDSRICCGLGVLNFTSSFSF